MNPTRSERCPALRVLSIAVILLAGVCGGSLPADAAIRGATGAPSMAAQEQRAAPAGQLVPVSGVVLTATGTPVAGAHVSAGDGSPETHTDAQGRYVLMLPPGDYTLRIAHPSFAPLSHALRVAPGLAPLTITLTALPYRYEENIVVRAVRAEPAAPVTATNLPRAEIDQLNYGQEVPFLLKAEPSLTQYADAGSAAGYAYLSLRGIQQTRLNMTLDGVPLNEPEDSAVYFSNYADLAASIDSVQVQRGVGTSTFGAASYGGSINFASVDPKPAREIAAEVGVGSFGTTRLGFTVHSGVVGRKLALYARGAYRDADGYREHSGVRQRGLFFGATRSDDRSLFKAFGFVGHSRTGLAYLAVEKDLLAVNPRLNPLGPEERDDFVQRFVHAQYTRFLSQNTSVAAQGYYQDAGGWYRMWASAARDSLYQYGLDWRYGGGMFNVQHVSGRATLTAGVHAYTYESRHTRDVVDRGAEYLNRGFKTTTDAFAKLTWASGPVTMFGDVQARRVGFRYEGDLDLGSVSWTFVNPKAGVRVRMSPALSAYASAGRMGREPTRADLFLGEDNPTVRHDLHAVRPEQVVDVEAGVAYTTGPLTVAADVYAMEFRNEIALTGELSEIGLPLRRNVARSHRRGVELDVAWRPIPQLRLRTTAAISHDRIGEWTQAYDVYDEEGNWTDSVLRTFTGVRPLLSPAVVVNQRIEISPRPWLTLAAAGRWVGRSWLDNTDTGGLDAPAWFSADLAASVSLASWVKTGSPRLRFHVDNALDNRHIYASGYSYQYLVRDPAAGDRRFGTPYYYPQATRSIFVGLELRF